MNKMYHLFNLFKGPIKEISQHPISFFLPLLTVKNALKDLRASDGFIWGSDAPFRTIEDTVELNKLTTIWLKTIWNFFPYYFQIRIQL